MDNQQNKKGTNISTMDPISAVLGGVSAIGNIFTAWQNNKNVKRQLQAQKEENALNRQFNHDEAELSRQYNTEMVDKANAYNTPQANVSRLMDAGLHPSLAYGNLGSTAMVTGSTSQQASTQNSVSSVTPDLSSISNIAKDIAEIGLIKAQTRKTDSEVELNDVELTFANEIKEGQVKLQNAQIDLTFNTSVLTQTEITKAAQVTSYYEQLTTLTRNQSDIAEMKRNIELTHWGYYQKHPDELESFFHSEIVTAVANSQIAQNNVKLSSTHAQLAFALGMSQILYNNRSAENQYRQSLVHSQKYKEMVATYQDVIENLNHQGYILKQVGHNLHIEGLNNLNDYLSVFSGASDFINWLFGAVDRGTDILNIK